MPDKKKRKPQCGATTTKPGKKTVEKADAKLSDQELDKVVGGANLLRRLS